MPTQSSTDRPAIMNAMAKTAAARQQWIRSEQLSITEVIEQYPWMEDMPFDMVYTNANGIYRCTKPKF